MLDVPFYLFRSAWTFPKGVQVRFTPLLNVWRLKER